LASVITHPIHHGGLVYNGGVVDISDVGDVVNRAVVVELAITPVSSLVPISVIAISIIDAAIEADFRTPVAGVPQVCAVAPSPITRRPQKAGLRC
jgi:hypothetical protein